MGLSSRQNEKKRFLKFGIVGGSGVIVNGGLLWLLAELTPLPFYLCSILAIEVSIISNFIFNDAWTWHDKREGHIFARLCRYNVSAAFSSLCINVTVLLFLKEWIGIHYLIANLCGIGCSVVFNFLINSYWTYGDFRFKYSRSVWLIFFASLGFRLLLAAGLGAGFDEAYYYGYSLHPSLSYFDHPPLVGFLAGYFPYLTGIATAFTIRLASILLYSMTGLLLYQLARQFVDINKATWAMLIFNITPMFFLLAGIFVLPDAGLAFFWILTLLAFYQIIFKKAKNGDWLLAGLATGFALLAKYHGVLLGLFLFLYLLLYDRKKFLSIGPYLFGIVVLVIFSPVLIWNAQHDWISFTFQGSRALGSMLNLKSFLQALGGQLGYLTPMIFFPMFFVFVKVTKKALLRGTQAEVFYLFFGVLPVGLFLAVSLVQPIMPHWTLPGYILLTIPLGAMIEPLFRQKRWVRGLTWGAGFFLAVLLSTAFMHTKYGVLHLEKLAQKGILSEQDVEMDATLDMHGWEEVGRYLSTHNISPEDVFLVTNKWMLSGEVALATGGKYTVMCFNEGDPRGFGIWDKNIDVIGRDALFIFSNRYMINPELLFSENFVSFGPTESIPVYRGGIQAKTLYFMKCKNLIQKYTMPF